MTTMEMTGRKERATWPQAVQGAKTGGRCRWRRD